MIRNFAFKFNANKPKISLIKIGEKAYKTVVNLLHLRQNMQYNAACVANKPHIMAVFFKYYNNSVIVPVCVKAGGFFYFHAGSS